MDNLLNFNDQLWHGTFFQRATDSFFSRFLVPRKRIKPLKSIRKDGNLSILSTKNKNLSAAFTTFCWFSVNLIRFLPFFKSKKIRKKFGCPSFLSQIYQFFYFLIIMSLTNLFPSLLRWIYQVKNCWNDAKNVT